MGGADVVTIQDARSPALGCRRVAKQGQHPRFHAQKEIPTFEEVAKLVHIERLPTWKNPKHGQQWITTLRDYAFPKVGRMPVNAIGQPEVLAILSLIWRLKHETAKRLAQRIKVVLDVAKSKGLREGENPVTAIQDAGALPKVRSKPRHHAAMDYRLVPEFYTDLSKRKSIAAKALMFTCLTGGRTSEVLGATWQEFDSEKMIWSLPGARMKTGEDHRVPLTTAMNEILDALRPLGSTYVFEGQKRHQPLSNMSMLMLLRRMKVEGVTVQGK